MSAPVFISRHKLSEISCSLQAFAHSWWIQRDGVAELSEPTYLALAPYLQIALAPNERSIPSFFYVGELSLTAQILGHEFTPARHAGEWWDDGGYAAAVSGIYSEVAETQEPSLEAIKAHIRLPGNHPIILNYHRMCLPTRLETGQTTITVVTSQKSILRVVN